MPAYRALMEWLERQTQGGIRTKQQEADAMFRRLGITFAVYGAEEANERLIPFDVIPRVRSVEPMNFCQSAMKASFSGVSTLMK